MKGVPNIQGGTPYFDTFHAMLRTINIDNSGFDNVKDVELSFLIFLVRNKTQENVTLFFI